MIYIKGEQMAPVISITEEMLKRLSEKDLELFLSLFKKMIISDETKSPDVSNPLPYEKRLQYNVGEFQARTNYSPGLIKVNNQFSIIINDVLEKIPDREGYYAYPFFSIWDTLNDIVYADFRPTHQDQLVFEEIIDLIKKGHAKAHGKAYSLEEFETIIIEKYCN